MNAPVRRHEAALPANHPRVAAAGQIGVLLVNLGTPDDTGYWPMRRYLSEFLSDRRVIEYPSWLWQPILQGIVLTTRPFRSGAAYRRIWRQESNESPLRHFTREQARRLSERIGSRQLHVDWAMRYGNPSIASRLDALREKGCSRILIFALYPQYSATTTATVYDKAFEALRQMRWQPAVRTVPPFHDHPVFIEGIARSIERRIEDAGWEPEVVLMSYHGIPKSYFDKGDPYHCFCHKTTRLVRERLGWDDARLVTTFQSRFGPEQWLQPYTDETLEALARQGTKRLMIASPAFLSDCLETLEELAIEGRETFLEAGGEQFEAIACLNADDDAIDLLEAVATQELSGWRDAAHDRQYDVASWRAVQVA